jgi:hypothetical protein
LAAAAVLATTSMLMGKKKSTATLALISRPLSFNAGSS